MEERKIHPQDRVDIKNVIVSLMLASPPASQKQLSEALTIIAESDFPAQWTNLLPVIFILSPCCFEITLLIAFFFQELISKIQVNNPVVMNGILQTAHSIFKRYRSQVKGDSVLQELQLVLAQFASPFLEIIRVQFLTPISSKIKSGNSTTIFLFVVHGILGYRPAHHGQSLVQGESQSFAPQSLLDRQDFQPPQHHRSPRVLRGQHWRVHGGVPQVPEL